MVEQEELRRLARTRSVAWSSSHHLSFSDQPVRVLLDTPKPRTCPNCDIYSRDARNLTLYIACNRITPSFTVIAVLLEGPLFSAVLGVHFPFWGSITFQRRILEMRTSELLKSIFPLNSTPKNPNPPSSLYSHHANVHVHDHVPHALHPHDPPHPPPLAANYTP